MAGPEDAVAARLATNSSAAAAAAANQPAVATVVAAVSGHPTTAAKAQRAAATETTAAGLPGLSGFKDTVDKLNAQYADIQTTLTNNAVSAQDEQKRMSALESTLGRFRWTGDVRVRGEDFFQTYSGCTACADRNRARIRVRFGFEGKLNDDFTAGVALATGSLGDPTTTNETFTNFFDRKTIGPTKGLHHLTQSLTNGFTDRGQVRLPMARTWVTGDQIPIRRLR
jgi:hypothetical protein